MGWNSCGEAACVTLFAIRDPGVVHVSSKVGVMPRLKQKTHLPCTSYSFASMQVAAATDICCIRYVYGVTPPSPPSRRIFFGSKRRLPPYYSYPVLFHVTEVRTIRCQHPASLTDEATLNLGSAVFFSRYWSRFQVR